MRYRLGFVSNSSSVSSVTGGTVVGRRFEVLEDIPRAYLDGARRGELPLLATDGHSFALLCQDDVGYRHRDVSADLDVLAGLDRNKCRAGGFGFVVPTGAEVFLDVVRWDHEAPETGGKMVKEARHEKFANDAHGLGLDFAKPEAVELAVPARKESGYVEYWPALQNVDDWRLVARMAEACRPRDRQAHEREM